MSLSPAFAIAAVVALTAYALYRAIDHRPLLAEGLLEKVS
jgi:hypothetical protein